jgi:hypothetical protein
MDDERRDGVRERRNIKRGRTKLEEREGRRRKEGGREAQ